ncbi:hypothetical protein H102_02876 [Trichophyton rubrum CBS 100081]|nr:hypothetical protein H102_02876 [Trichophyton rubrum CBS 100081]
MAMLPRVGVSLTGGSMDEWSFKEADAEKPGRPFCGACAQVSFQETLDFYRSSPDSRSE